MKRPDADPYFCKISKDPSIAGKAGIQPFRGFFPAFPARFLLDRQIFRLLLFKPHVVPESSFLRDGCRVREMKRYMFRFVGIGTEGDLFAAQFPVSSDNIRRRIRHAKACLVAAGVDFQRDIVLNQLF